MIVREIADDRVHMYPVWWEDERFQQYLAAAARIPAVVALGRLGLYKYVTMDTTYGMVLRLMESLERFLGADSARRLEVLRELRGDWRN